MDEWKYKAEKEHSMIRRQNFWHWFNPSTEENLYPSLWSHRQTGPNVNGRGRVLRSSEIFLMLLQEAGLTHQHLKYWSTRNCVKCSQTFLHIYWWCNTSGAVEKKCGFQNYPMGSIGIPWDVHLFSGASPSPSSSHRQEPSWWLFKPSWSTYMLTFLVCSSWDRGCLMANLDTSVESRGGLEVYADIQTCTRWASTKAAEALGWRFHDINSCWTNWF